MKNIPLNTESNPTTKLNLTEKQKQERKRRNRLIVIIIIILSLFTIVNAVGVIDVFNGFFNRANPISTSDPINNSNSRKNNRNTPSIITPNNTASADSKTQDISINIPEDISTPLKAKLNLPKPISPLPAGFVAPTQPQVPTPTQPNIPTSIQPTIPNQPDLPILLNISTTLIKCDATCADINTIIIAGNNTILDNGIVYSTTPNPTLSNTVISSQDRDGNFDSLINKLSITNNYYIRSYVTTPSGTVYSNQLPIINTLSTPHASAPNDTLEIFDNLAGEGTTENPYIITNDWELQAINEGPTAHYKLGNNIDASGTETWNNGNGFTPIDNFTGSFDGDGYGVLGLTINRENDSEIGLFATTDNAKLYNIVLQDNYILGYFYVGGIVGDASGETEIRNAVVDGVSWARFGQYGGGLIGYMNNGVIDNSITSGQVHGSGNIIGGLVGHMQDGTISDSTSNADIDGGESIGGLVGNMAGGEILNSCANGDILVNRDLGISKDGVYGGGLVGSMSGGTISGSHATGNVDLDSDTGGGFIGLITGNSSITNSYATGNVSAANTIGGGFAGGVYGNASITNSYATGDISVGVNYGGGFIGILDTVSGAVSNSYATGQVRFYNASDLTPGDFVIADGSLPEPTNLSVGGFVGEMRDTNLFNNYSTGRVLYDHPGFPNPTNKGFAGKLSFLGNPRWALNLSNNYWNTETSLQASSGTDVFGVDGITTPLTTAEMYQQDSFDTWDFDTIWQINNGISYPTLRNINSSNCNFTCFKSTPELLDTTPIVDIMDCVTPPITNNLLLYLDVCRTSYPGYGSTWNDLSTNNTDAILSGDPIVYNSSDGGNIIFNNNQNFTVNPPSPPSLSNYTYNTWVKPLQLGVGNFNYIYILSSNDGVNSFSSYVYVDNDTIILEGNSSDSNYENYSYNTGVILEPDQWYNIATTHSNNDTIKLYIDGVLVYETPAINNYPLNPTQFFIGNAYQGPLSHVSIYDRALDQTELEQFFDATKSRFSISQGPF